MKNKEIKIKADKGYQGIKKIHPNSEIPYKKSKKKPLNKEQKKYNRNLIPNSNQESTDKEKNEPIMKSE